MSAQPPLPPKERGNNKITQTSNDKALREAVEWYRNNRRDPVTNLRIAPNLSTVYRSWTAWAKEQDLLSLNSDRDIGAFMRGEQGMKSPMWESLRNFLAAQPEFADRSVALPSTVHSVDTENASSTASNLQEMAAKFPVAAINGGPAELGFVYVLEETPHFGAYKIGMTGDTEERVAGLQQGNPRNLNLKVAISTLENSKLEAALKKYLRPRRVRGEWFRLSETEVDIVVGLATTLPSWAIAALPPFPASKDVVAASSSSMDVIGESSSSMDVTGESSS